MILSKPNYIKIYGHRGARGDLPENTLESFKYLFDNNFSGLEVDILFSKDLVPVITHDFFLDKDLIRIYQVHYHLFIKRITTNM